MSTEWSYCNYCVSIQEGRKDFYAAYRPLYTAAPISFNGQTVFTHLLGHDLPLLKKLLLLLAKLGRILSYSTFFQGVCAGDSFQLIMKMPLLPLFARYFQMQWC